MKRQGRNTADPAQQDGGKGHPEGSAPDEGVFEMDVPFHLFMYQDGTSKAPL